MNDQNQQACPDISKKETRKKQLYLKENIMGAGYDPDDFATYLEEEKEGGIDIENWTFEELETVVHLFKKSRDIYREEDMQNGNQYNPNDLMNDSKVKPSNKISNANSSILSIYIWICLDYIYLFINIYIHFI